MDALIEAATSPSSTALSQATQRVVLIGYMGAGKSTLGRLLAAELGWDFVDTDTEVETRHGRTISRMFAEEGEEAFRRRESLALARALGRRKVVIAVGGGAPEILTNRLLLEQTAGTAVVYLEAAFDILFDRCVLQEGASVRPVLLNPEAAAERFRVRAPMYQRCAKHRIKTGNLTTEQTVTQLLALFR